MRFAIIGLGSMGKRRLRLLNKYIENEKKERSKWEILGIDFSEQRRIESEQLYGIKTYASLNELLEKQKVDCAIVSTSPLSHRSIIYQCLSEHLHVFAELNLRDKGYDDNIALAENNKKILFLSSTFCYRKEIEYIKEKVNQISFGGVYRHHVGQYLPQWHPWESYKDYFISKKETNGCREFMAIELPWLVDIFGNIKSFHCVHKKISQLDIEYDDCYQIIVEHESGVSGTINVDVVIPQMKRRFEMWQENFYLSWEGTPDTLREYNYLENRMEEIALYDNYSHEKEYNHSIVEDAYYEELVNFINVIQGSEKPRYSFEKDKVILEMIDKFES